MKESLSSLEKLGGETALRAIIDDFVERVCSDMMIGFFFRKSNKTRLKALEVQFAMNHLGGATNYQGRDMKGAHAAHRIMGGHFDRRLRILENTLNDHGIDPSVRDEWLSHNEALRSQITPDEGGECVGESPSE